MSAREGEQAISTICGFCHTNCGMLAYVQAGRLDRVRGNPQHPANSGHLCPKGLAAGEVVYSPQRLKMPLKRVGNTFQEISWDEALEMMANRLLEIKAKHGARALLHCSGAPVTEESRDAFTQLMAAYGSPNRTSPGHLCSIPRRIALDLVYGGRSDCDYSQAKLLLVWGANPIDAMRPAEDVAYGRFDRVLPEAKKRGARIIAIDPRYTPTAALADEWVPIRLGTDAALELAMLNVIIGEGLYDAGFVKEWTVGFSKLREHVQPFTPEWAEPRTGIPAAKIGELARLYATTKP
ncbi:MAG: molybdopterin-dependent oxidoreductase, partial [Dehalococcoidia bacterium]|nr:molybdopterin-dependent oxidoreductase [Dehalococcoidia bacterium]